MPLGVETGAEVEVDGAGVRAEGGVGFGWIGEGAGRTGSCAESNVTDLRALVGRDEPGEGRVSDVRGWGAAPSEPTEDQSEHTQYHTPDNQESNTGYGQ